MCVYMCKYDQANKCALNFMYNNINSIAIVLCRGGVGASTEHDRTAGSGRTGCGGSSCLEYTTGIVFV